MFFFGFRRFHAAVIGALQRVYHQLVQQALRIPDLHTFRTMDPVLLHIHDLLFILMQRKGIIGKDHIRQLQIQINKRNISFRLQPDHIAVLCLCNIDKRRDGCQTKMFIRYKHRILI